MPSPYHLIINSSFKIAAVWIIIQQMIVASSTYFIADLAKSVAQGQLSATSLLLFVVSLIIVYVPAYFSIIYLEKAKYQALNLYYQQFQQRFFGKTALLSDHQLKQNATTILSQESKSTIDYTLGSLFDVLSLVLNIAFNLFIFAWLLKSDLLLAYIVGSILSFAFIYYQSRHIKDKAHTAQKSRVDLLSHLSASWDNTVIANQYNHSIYQNTLNQSLKNAKQHNVACEATKHTQSTIGMILLMLPVLMVSAYLIWQYQSNHALLAMLIATLPRQIQLLQMCYSLINHQANFSVIKARLDGIMQIFHQPNADLHQYIQHDKIFIGQTGQIFNAQQLPNTGRITLIGENGVGKSCTLLLLKQNLGEKAYYLPTKHQLYFKHTQNNHQGSTGQKLIQEIHEITSQNQNLILLLDEWDAHLDSHNTQVLDDYLQDLSQKQLIIEIRHKIAQ